MDVLLTLPQYWPSATLQDLRTSCIGIYLKISLVKMSEDSFVFHKKIWIGTLGKWRKYSRWIQALVALPTDLVSHFPEATPHQRGETPSLLFLRVFSWKGDHYFLMCVVFIAFGVWLPEMCLHGCPYVILATWMCLHGCSLYMDVYTNVLPIWVCLHECSPYMLVPTQISLRGFSLLDYDYSLHGCGNIGMCVEMFSSKHGY